MSTSDAIVCGRTTPLRPAEARAFLHDRTQALLAAEKRIKPFLKPRRKVRFEDMPAMWYYARPMIPPKLPDGSSAFLFNEHDDLGGFGGQYTLRSLDDPAFGRLWAIGFEAKSGRCSLALLAEKPRMLNWAILDIDKNPSERGILHRLQIQYNPHPEFPGGQRDLLEALDIAQYAAPADLEPQVPKYPEQNFMIVLNDLPADPGIATRLLEGLGRLPFRDAGGITRKSLLLALDEPEYGQLRPRINAAARDWTQGIYAWHRPGFDPYQPPEAIEEEYRFPVAQYIKETASFDENLVIQVDAVHTPAGSFLEFQTHFGPKRLKKYAELAGVELEMWRGPLAERWGGN